MPVFENERGTFIYNSKDLCMIENIKDLVECGLDSFKIEGRVKTEYYLATVVKAYRDAIDAYFEDSENYEVKDEWLNELLKVSHRGYTTGFYYKKPDGNEQNYETSSYIRNYELCGIVCGYDRDKKMLSVIQKNRFFKGAEVEFLCPDRPFITHKIEYMEDAEGNEIEVANRPMQIVHIKFDAEIPINSMMRQVKE